MPANDMDSTDQGFELVEEDNVLPTALPFARLHRPRLTLWVRIVQVLAASVLIAVFVTAVVLNPYNADGTRRTMETHRQLGLPPCNMVVLTGKPCPSCGMTTSFTMLMHGDIVGSMQANWVGTLLALYCLCMIPWLLISAYRGECLWVRSGELLITIAMVGFLILMLLRWAAVLYS